MADIIIHGPPQSSYVRTARMTATEKGITHELKPVGENLGSLHPYKKFPILEHNGFRVFETSAICTYIDSVFDGPSLVPTDVKARASMDQWISCVDCYVYKNAITNYALKYIFAGENGPDRETIDATLPKLENDLNILDAAYGAEGFIVGNEVTLADLFIAPIVQTAMMFPEGKGLVTNCKNIMRAFEQVASRESFKAALPPMPGS